MMYRTAIFWRGFLEQVDCERLLRSAGSFTLSFLCPDPYGYALLDENFVLSETGNHEVERHIGNTESFPVYALQGVIPSGVSSYISIQTGGEELRVIGPLAEEETLLVDSSLVTAKVDGCRGKHAAQRSAASGRAELPGAGKGL